MANFLARQRIATIEKLHNDAVLLNMDQYGAKIVKKSEILQELISLERINPHRLSSSEIRRYRQALDDANLAATTQRLEAEAIMQARLLRAYAIVAETFCDEKSNWRYQPGLGLDNVGFSNGGVTLRFGLDENALLYCIFIMSALAEGRNDFDQQVVEAMKTGVTTFSTKATSTLSKVSWEQRKKLLATIGLACNLQLLEK